MANYFIHIDSSTEQKKGEETSFGISTVAWTVEVNKCVIRRGIIYNHFTGPNKILYEGLIAAISTLEVDHFYPGGTDMIIVYLDSTTVIDQIEGNMRAVRMKKYLDKINEIRTRLVNVTFVFAYKNEKDPDFKEVDNLSKQARQWIPKIVNSLKKK